MKPRSILITGGAGFIGSHLVRHFVVKYPEYQIINLDALTYAGNLANVRDVSMSANYSFVHANVTDHARMRQLIREHHITGIIHLAAESHVDRSIHDPFTFARTNIMGTLSLLQAALEEWSTDGDMHECRFYQISTDEVYGSLSADAPPFSELNKYDPHSPYSASKASCDHFVRAYHDTYGLPILISNCSNNYGPYQHPEKLIPLFINNIKTSRPLPVYGAGDQIRDWLYVEDHVAAIDLIFHHGEVGETYNVGGRNERTNIDVIKKLVYLVDERLGRPEGSSLKLITHVQDRLGHDTRYAIDSTKLEQQLGWQPSHSFEQGLAKTVDWYLIETEWLSAITSGEYASYYHQMYHKR